MENPKAFTEKLLELVIQQGRRILGQYNHMPPNDVSINKDYVYKGGPIRL